MSRQSIKKSSVHYSQSSINQICQSEVALQQKPLGLILWRPWMSVLNLSASQPEVVWMFSLASVDDNYDELIQLLLIYTLNNPCLRVSPSAFSLFFFSSSVFLLHLVLAVTYRSVSQGGLHDNICLVMTLFGLFLVCDPPGPSPPPRLLQLHVYHFSFDGFPQTFHSGPSQEERCSSLKWNPKAEAVRKCGHNLVLLFTLMPTKSHFSLKCWMLFWKEVIWEVFYEGQSKSKNNSLLIEPSPLQKKCNFKLWDKEE